MAQFDTKEIVIGSTEWKTAPFRFSKMFTLGGGSGQSYIDVLLSGVSPLALTNALGLNYIKALGATEQRNLPSGYTQVEYLESTGTQYIDTGVVPKTTLSVKIKYNVLQLTASNNIAIFGSISNQTGLFSGVADNPSAYYINSGATKLSNIPFSLNTIQEEEYINNTMIRSGVTYTTNPIVENNISIVLFGRNTGTEVARIGTLRIYYFTLYDNGVLIQNLVPCKRNSDNVLGMYDTVTGNFLTNSGTGTFTAGNDVVPSPDNPVDIICNNGVLKVATNLVNIANSTKGKYIKNDGDIADSTNWAISDYLPVIAGGKVSVSGLTYVSSAAGFNWYDSTKTKISTIPYEDGTHTYTVPNNASYLMITYRWVDDENTIKAYIGDTYGAIYTDGTIETVDIVGKNLFNKNDSGLGNGYILATSGEVTSTARGHTGYFKVKPATTYHVTLDVYQQGTTNGVAFYDKDKNYVSGIASQNSYGNPPYNFTVPNNNSIVYARLTLTNNIAQTNLDVIQIEQGTTATDYEPYCGTANAEMLLKVGTYQDNHELLTGNVTRNIGIKVFDGTENWQLINTPYFSLAKTDITPSTLSGGNFASICSHFIRAQNGTELPTKVSFYWGNSYLNINIDVSGSTTIAQFKQYLADQYANGTPVIVVYPLATPTTETVTGQSLTVSGNCTVTATGSLDNLELELSYKQSI